MRELADSGMSMLIVTHEMGFAREVGNRVIFSIDGGEIVEDGPPQVVLTNPSSDRARRFLQKVLRERITPSITYQPSRGLES